MTTPSLPTQPARMDGGWVGSLVPFAMTCPLVSSLLAPLRPLTYTLKYHTTNQCRELKGATTSSIMPELLGTPDFLRGPKKC